MAFLHHYYMNGTCLSGISGGGKTDRAPGTQDENRRAKGRNLPFPLAFSPLHAYSIDWTNTRRRVMAMVRL
jgi:hypothetical protein